MPFSYKREANRRKIIKAATRLFRSAYNINKVSIEDIAQEAQVSPTTIYNNFLTKDNLITEVIRQISLSSLETYLAIVRSDLPFPQKIQRIIKEKIAAARELDWDCILKLIAQDPQMAAFWEEQFENEAKPMLFSLIEDGKRQGYIEPALSSAAILKYIEIITEGAQSFYRTFEATPENNKILQELNQIYFYGFVNRDIQEEKL